MSNCVVDAVNQTIEDIWMILEKREEQFMSFSLNSQQYVLLTLVIRHPLSAPSELAERMGITKSAVSQLLAKLENDGYIVRKQDTEDKRSYSIELGEMGRRYKDEVEAFKRHIADKYRASLSSDELNDMLSSLQKLHHILVQE